MSDSHDGRTTTKATLSRRDLLRRGVALGAGSAALGFLPATDFWGFSAAAYAAPVAAGKAGRVIVNTGGGAYADAKRKAIWEPFTAESGIQVVPFIANGAKTFAALQTNNGQIDVVGAGEFTQITYAQRGWIAKLDHAKFKRTNPADFPKEYVTEYYMGENTYATVLGYNTQAYPKKHPSTWAEFWDVKTFPGGRVLEDMAAESPNLEFALLADGVPMDKLYPLDVARAFRKLRAIRPHILKWWDTGALPAQMLAGKQAVLGSVWNGRILSLMEAGAPLAIEWNQSQRLLSTEGIVNGAPNLENAYKYVDYALQPKVQAEMAKLIPYGPANRKAFDYLTAKEADGLPTSPEHLKVSFATDARWWVEHRPKVAQLWQEFLLGG